MLRDVYRYSDISVKQLCRRYGLSKESVEKYIKLGDWDRLRKDHRQMLFSTFVKERGEILEQTQSIIHRMELYNLIDLEHRMADLENHYMEHGDTFIRDSDGEIVRNALGNPISRKPISKDELLILKELREARELNGQFLQNEILRLKKEEKEKLKGESTLDIEDIMNGELDE